ncbi:MAG: GPW/gp25 family protein [Candidatus Promineifilaceae bacterium]
MDNGKLLYGQSLGFPPRVGPDGRLIWSNGEENVRESICIILRTRPGERLELPEFGCGLDQYLFEPNNISNLRLIQESVKQSLTRWEPRIKLDDIRVALNPTDPTVVDITIFYTLIATRKREKVNLSVSV